MLVKVRDQVYDSGKEPVMIVLSAKDRMNIEGMLPSARKYCSFPETVSGREVMEFMKIPIGIDKDGNVYLKEEVDA